MRLLFDEGDSLWGPSPTAAPLPYGRTEATSRLPNPGACIARICGRLDSRPARSRCGRGSSASTCPTLTTAIASRSRRERSHGSDCSASSRARACRRASETPARRPKRVPDAESVALRRAAHPREPGRPRPGAAPLLPAPRSHTAARLAAAGAGVVRRDPHDAAGRRGHGVNGCRRQRDGERDARGEPTPEPSTIRHRCVPPSAIAAVMQARPP